MSLKQIFSQVQEVNNDRRGIFEDQAFIEMSEENPSRLDVILQPIYGSFAGARVKFRLELPETFPTKPPACTCLTQIFHPNVSFSGSVCFNLFGAEWLPGTPLTSVVVALLWLLSNPNPDSALNSACRVPMAEFDICVASAIMGGCVRGTTYPPHLSPDLSPALARRFGASALLLALGKRKCLPLSEAEPCFSVLPASLRALTALKPQTAEIFVQSQPPRHPALTVRARAKVLNRLLGTAVDPCQVMKEVFLLVDGRPVIVLTAGPERLDLNSLAELLESPLASLVVPSSQQSAPYFADKEKGFSQFSPLEPDSWAACFVEGVEWRVVLDERLSLQPSVFVPYEAHFVHLDTAAFFRLHPSLKSGFVTVTPKFDVEEACVRGRDKRFAFYFPNLSALALSS